MTPDALPLRDLHLPDPIGWWPLAPGWWVLIAIAVAGLAWLARRWVLALRRNAARRYALRRLQRAVRDYEQHGNAVRLGTELSALLRRTMLAYAPRADVAGLTGEAWLEFLDRGLDRPAFVSGDGRPVVEWPYRNPATDVPRPDVAAFVDAVRVRIATPLPESA